MALSDDERRRIARAIWAYAGGKQPEFARSAGIEYHRFRAALNDPAKTAPTTDELVAMARAAGIPETVALEGWVAADPHAQINARIDALQRDLGSEVSAVRKTVAQLVARVAEIERGSSSARLDAGRSSRA